MHDLTLPSECHASTNTIRQHARETTPLPDRVVAASYQTPALIAELRTKFETYGYVKLQNFLTPQVFSLVREDVLLGHEGKVRRDFVMPEYETDRHMSVLGGQEIVHTCSRLVDLYANRQLRSIVTRLVGREVVVVGHAEEFMVMNFLDSEQDTHGWHLDDPRYALIVVIEAPTMGGGGHIEFVPGWRELAQAHGLDPIRNIDEGLEIASRLGSVMSDHLEAGDCYLLDAGEVLHRVAEIRGPGKRKALNIAYDDRRYRVYGETATRLYGGE